MFKVQSKMCDTCIYRKSSPLDIEQLEAEVKDKYVGFASFRICHHADEKDGICCRGFWDRHKNEFTAGQLAQRLHIVQFVEVDNMKE